MALPVSSSTEFQDDERRIGRKSLEMFLDVVLRLEEFEICQEKMLRNNYFVTIESEAPKEIYYHRTANYDRRSFLI